MLSRATASSASRGCPAAAMTPKEPNRKSAPIPAIHFAFATMVHLPVRPLRAHEVQATHSRAPDQIVDVFIALGGSAISPASGSALSAQHSAYIAAFIRNALEQRLELRDAASVGGIAILLAGEIDRRAVV